MKPMIKAFAPNELDYASQDPANITMSIRFDNAVQTPLGEGIGSSVARTVGQVVTG